MSAKIAAYDSALERAEANYWAWSHPSLSSSTLKDILYAVIRNKPDDIEDVEASAIVGGIKTLNDDECVAYRFVNGGRDDGGRPGRLVILLAVASIDEVLRHNAMTLLRSPVLAEMATAAVSGGVPQPNDLQLEVTGDKPVVTREMRCRCHGNVNVVLDDVDQASEAFVLAASRPDRRCFEVVIDTRSAKPIGRLRLTTALLFSEEERGVRPPPPATAEQRTTVPPLPPPIRSTPPVDSGLETFGTNYRLQRNILLVIVVVLVIITMLSLLLSGGSSTSTPPGTGRLPPGGGGSLPVQPDTKQETLAYIHYYEVTHPDRGPAIDEVAGYIFRSNTAEARMYLDSLAKEGKVAERSEMSVTGRVTSYRLACDVRTNAYHRRCSMLGPGMFLPSQRHGTPSLLVLRKTRERLRALLFLAASRRTRRQALQLLPLRHMDGVGAS